MTTEESAERRSQRHAQSIAIAEALDALERVQRALSREYTLAVEEGDGRTQSIVSRRHAEVSALISDTLRVELSLTLR